MTKYSFNRNPEGMIFASLKDVNASFKDLAAVCAAIRYKSYAEAVEILGAASEGKRPIEFKRHNKGMGHRHELGGKKGRWPAKCSKLVMKVVNNAAANARNKDYEPDLMYVVHASANKTQTWGRMPPKGVRAVPGNHTMGYLSSRVSNLEHARIEIALAKGTEPGLSDNMKSAIKRSQAYMERRSNTQKPAPAQHSRKAASAEKKPQGKQAKTPEKKATSDSDKQAAQANAVSAAGAKSGV